VKAHQAFYPVTVMCRVLDVSTSGYYAWRKRPESERRQKDLLLGNRIEAIHQESRGTYGRPRIHAELKEEGIAVGGKRVARLMQERTVLGASRRKSTVRTTRTPGAYVAPDLVQRKFVADAPNQLWVADITHVPISRGFLYVAVIIDVFSRLVVGWGMATDLGTELVLSALNMAIFRRRPKSVILHTDQGSQYTSIANTLRCLEAGIRISMGSVGDCYDNALCESFNATLECELLVKHRFETAREAGLEVFEFIESWYNPRRRHSALGYLSPEVYERRMTPPLAV
jgi:putative transposase